MAWCSVVAKAPQESQESDENVHFFLQGFASCLPVIKTFFIGANAFDCMFLLLLRALVQARKDEKGCRMSKETRVSFVSSPGGWRAVGGLRFTPSSAVTAALLPVDRASPGSLPEPHTKGSPQDWEWLQEHNTPGEPRFGGTYYLFIIYFYLFPPAQEVILFYQGLLPL